MRDDHELNLSHLIMKEKMMMMRYTLLGALVVVSTTVSALPALAQSNDVHGYVAIGAATLPEYEGADAQQVIPFFTGRAQRGQRYIAVEGVSARANLLTSSAWEAGPLASITFGRDDDIDSVAVARLPSLDDAIELGGFVAYSWSDVARDGDALRVEARAIGDASDVYGGWQSSFAAGYSTPLGQRLRLGS